MHTCRPLDTWSSVIDNILQIIFLIDMIVTFCVAYYEEELLVTDGRMIAKRYFRSAAIPGSLCLVPQHVMHAAVCIRPASPVQTSMSTSLCL